MGTRMTTGARGTRGHIDWSSNPRVFAAFLWQAVERAQPGHHPFPVRELRADRPKTSGPKKGRVVDHRLFEECPQSPDPASLGLARVSVAGSCGVDRFVLGADLLGLGVAMRALLARCSGESSGRLDVHWLGGSRGDGMARQADSPQSVCPSRAPILKGSERPRITDGFPLWERCNLFLSSHGVMRMREHPRSLRRSGVLRPGLRLWSPARATTTGGRGLFDGSWLTQGAGPGYSRCRLVALKSHLMRDDTSRNTPVPTPP